MEDIQQIIIQSVDTETLKATGVNRFGNTIYVDLRIMCPKLVKTGLFKKYWGRMLFLQSFHSKTNVFCLN